MLAELKTKFANMKALLPYNQNDQPTPLDQQKGIEDQSPAKAYGGKKSEKELA